ncbi:hypothetical protein PIB30_077071, partial [Stylosanthes scabra]|nr:hypothetical protein [Stylosanthes scabra]
MFSFRSEITSSSLEILKRKEKDTDTYSDSKSNASASSIVSKNEDANVNGGSKGKWTLATVGVEGAATLESDDIADQRYHNRVGVLNVEQHAAPRSALLRSWERSGGTRDGEAVTLTNSGGNGDRGSAMVGVFVRREWTFLTAEDGATAKVTDGGLRARQLRRFVFLMPPPLLAAVFPWNRGSVGEEQSCSGLQQQVEGSIGDEQTSVTMTQPRSLAKWCYSLSSVGNGKNGGKEGFLSVELAAVHGGEKHGNLFEGESILFWFWSEKENTARGRVGQGGMGLGNPNSIGLGPIR